MSYTIHDRHTVDGASDTSLKVMFQSLTAAGRHSVADLEDGFDQKVTVGETRTWSAAPDRASWIGSMGRIAGHAQYDATGLRGEGIGPADSDKGYIVHTDGTAEAVDNETPLSVYAGVDQFDPDTVAHVSFDAHVDIEEAVHELTGGRPAWVRITTSATIESHTADIQTRSVPGGRNSGLPLKDLGKVMTTFAPHEDAANQTMEGYYLPRGAVHEADGIYYGLQPDSPGFLHIHNVPADIDEDGVLDGENAAVTARNALLGPDEKISVGGHVLSVGNANHVKVEIMNVSAAFVKAGMTSDGRTVMRPLVQHRNTEWEDQLRADIRRDVEEAGFTITDTQLDHVVEQHILDRDAAAHLAAGTDAPAIPAAVLERLQQRVEVMRPRDVREMPPAYFGLG